jgi:hypothetical protein
LGAKLAMILTPNLSPSAFEAFAYVVSPSKSYLPVHGMTVGFGPAAMEFSIFVRP